MVARALAAAFFATLLACGSASEPPAAPDGESSSVSSDEPVVLSHPAGVLLTVPAGWSRDDGGGTLSLLSADDTVYLTLLVVDVADLERALGLVGAAVDKIVKNAEITSNRKTIVHGMRTVVAAGTGEIEGDPVALGIALYLTPLRKVIIVIGISHPSAPPSTRQQLKDLMLGIRPNPKTRPPKSQQL